MAKDDQGRTLQKHTLHLFEGDFRRVAELFPAAEPSKVIRHLVRDLVKRVEGEALNGEVEVPGLDQ